MRLLSPKIHGVLDYLASALFALAPTMFAFDRASNASIACYVIAASLFIMSLFTRYPLGAVRLVPFTVHGGIECVAAPVLIALPWIVGFADLAVARWFFVATGASLFVLWLVTDYRAADHPSEVTGTTMHRPHGAWGR